jgi:hypothetical protein
VPNRLSGSGFGALAVAIALAACTTGSPGPATGSPLPATPPPASLSTAAPTPVPTAIPTTSTEPTASPWPTVAWSPPVAMPDGEFITDLVQWQTGYVGVGGIESASGLEVAFFTSTDGRSWTLAARRSEPERNVLAAHVVRFGNELVAVGQAVMDAPGERPGVPAPLWISGDGRTWSRVTSQAWDAAFPTVWPAWLLASSGHLVAMTSGPDPVIVSSADGRTWKRATLPVIERAVAEGARAWAGGFAVVGRDGQPDHFTEAAINSDPPPGVGRAAAWTSPDGVRWSEASVQGDRLPGAGLDHVGAMGSGLLAVGTHTTADFYTGTATSWTSLDGRTWTIVERSGWPLEAGRIPTFAADDTQIVLLGRAPEGPTLAAWTTEDGRSWTRLPFEGAGNGPALDCGSQDLRVRIDGAWLVSGGLIVLGTPMAGGSSQRVWLATAG